MCFDMNILYPNISIHCRQTTFSFHYRTMSCSQNIINVPQNLAYYITCEILHLPSATPYPLYLHKHKEVAQEPLPHFYCKEQYILVMYQMSESPEVQMRMRILIFRILWMRIWENCICGWGCSCGCRLYCVYKICITGIQLRKTTLWNGPLNWSRCGITQFLWAVGDKDIASTFVIEI